MHSTDEELFVLASVCEEEESRVNKRKKRFWVHNICQKRMKFGEYHCLFRDLVDDDSKFFNYFRMTHEKFRKLLNYLKEDLERENTTFRRSVEPEERLSVCLRFLATGNSFKSLAYSYRLGETTVREIVHSTCEAFWKTLQPMVMPYPTEERWRDIEKEFYQRWNFPNVIGAIDGKHVTIQAPPNSGSLYFSYKKTFSIVLMALVDANYKFICVDGGYAKNSDGGIFANSNLGKAIKNNTLGIPPDKKLPGSNDSIPHIIVGDEAFPLSRNMMRPYPGAQLKNDEKKKNFNYRLSRARNVSENAFGILVRKFRIFERKLCMSPEHANIVVGACCCLHNFLKDDSSYWTENEMDFSIRDAEAFTSLSGIGGNAAVEAIQIRELLKDYFTSDKGSVSWQNKMITGGRILS